MLDWRDFTDDPNDAKASELIRREISLRVKAYPGSRAAWLTGLAAGKRVLDIGGGEHVSRSSLSPDWEHAILLKSASQVVGIDLNRPLVEQLQAAGYDFRVVDATSEDDLGMRFDFVFAGDVIEHVNNPVALVRFALRHLATGGRALFTTPNPWISADPIQSVLRRGASRYKIRHVNLEHTCWITPTNFYEILIRSGGQLEALWIAQRAGSTRARKLAHQFVRGYSRLLGMEENSFPEFAYEVSVPGVALR